MKTLFCFLLGAVLLFGQFEYGEIGGTVRDATQAVVAGAKVTLRNLDTNLELATSTNQQGAYSFPGLRGGRYSVQTEMKGFRVANADLDLRTGDHLRNDVKLEAGSLSEKVTVEATA